MGPVKVAIVYLAETAEFSSDVRRRVVTRAVAVAGVMAAFLLHFITGALVIAGGRGGAMRLLYPCRGSMMASTSRRDR